MKYQIQGLGLVSIAIASLIAPPAHADLYLSAPSIPRQTYPANPNHGNGNPIQPTTTTLYRGFQIPLQPASPYPSSGSNSYPKSQQVITFPSVSTYQPVYPSTYSYPTYSYPTYSYPSQSYIIYNDPNDPYRRNSYTVYSYPIAPTVIYRQR